MRRFEVGDFVCCYEPDDPMGCGWEKIFPGVRVVAAIDGGSVALVGLEGWWGIDRFRLATRGDLGLADEPSNLEDSRDDWDPTPALPIAVTERIKWTPQILPPLLWDRVTGAGPYVDVHEAEDDACEGLCPGQRYYYAGGELTAGMQDVVALYPKTLTDEAPAPPESAIPTVARAAYVKTLDNLHKVCDERDAAWRELDNLRAAAQPSGRYVAAMVISGVANVLLMALLLGVALESGRSPGPEQSGVAPITVEWHD